LGVDEQRVNVVITLKDPPELWAALGDGYRVEARIELWRGDDVLQVPHGAVFRYGDTWATFVVEDGRALRREIQLGHRGDTTVEVTVGLRAGEQVAVHPSDRVSDGGAVAPHNQ
jgi:HlyD family secretion protein